MERPRRRCGRMRILSILDEIFCDVDNENLIRFTLQSLLDRDPIGFLQLFWIPLLPRAAFEAPALSGKSNAYAEASVTEQIAASKMGDEPAKHTKQTNKLPADEYATLNARIEANAPQIQEVFQRIASKDRIAKAAQIAANHGLDKQQLTIEDEIQRLAGTPVIRGIMNKLLSGEKVELNEAETVAYRKMEAIVVEVRRIETSAKES